MRCVVVMFSYLLQLYRSTSHRNSLFTSKFIPYGTGHAGKLVGEHSQDHAISELQTAEVERFWPF